jgi:hypothetical protein
MKMFLRHVVPPPFTIASWAFLTVTTPKSEREASSSAVAKGPPPARSQLLVLSLSPPAGGHCKDYSEKAEDNNVGRGNSYLLYHHQHHSSTTFFDNILRQHSSTTFFDNILRQHSSTTFLFNIDRNNAGFIGCIGAMPVHSVQILSEQRWFHRRCQGNAIGACLSTHVQSPHNGRPQVPRTYSSGCRKCSATTVSESSAASWTSPKRENGGRSTAL